MKNFYYEVILQIRGEFTEEILDFIDRWLHKFNEKDLYRSEEVKGGLDYYIANKSVGKKLAQILKKQFKGKLINSYKMHSVSREGTKLYKMTVSIRFG